MLSCCWCFNPANDRHPVVKLQSVHWIVLAYWVKFPEECNNISRIAENIPQCFRMALIIHLNRLSVCPDKPPAHSILCSQVSTADLASFTVHPAHFVPFQNQCPPPLKQLKLIWPRSACLCLQFQKKIFHFKYNAINIPFVFLQHMLTVSDQRQKLNHLVLKLVNNQAC